MSPTKLLVAIFLTCLLAAAIVLVRVDVGSSYVFICTPWLELEIVPYNYRRVALWRVEDYSTQGFKHTRHILIWSWGGQRDTLC